MESLRVTGVWVVVAMMYSRRPGRGNATVNAKSLGNSMEAVIFACCCISSSMGFQQSINHDFVWYRRQVRLYISVDNCVVI